MKHFRKISLVLSIVLITQNIFGQGWSVNPADYSSNGTVTAIIVHGTSDVTTGTLGAFVGGVCRGFTTGSFFLPTGKTVFTLTCYSNQLSGETLTFQYFDPSDNTFYNINETIPFNADMIIGDAYDPEVFHTLPLTYNVTGGGSYCQGGSGLPVGLDGSESGVTYTLLKDGNPQTPTINGTGSSIDFGDQLDGTYTVTGTNSGGTTNMTGSADITEIITPSPTASVTVQPTCSVSTGTIVITAPTGPVYEYNIDGGAYQSGTTFTGIAVGDHTLRTRLVAPPNCVSLPSSTLTVNAVPTLPPVPTASVTIQPTCAVPTGTIVVTAPTGASYQYNMDGGAYQSSVTFAGVSVGNHTLTTRLTASPTCISGPSSTLTVNAVPALPAAPTATVTVQPTCAVPTGTIVITAPTGAAYEYNMDGGTYQSSVTFTGVSVGNHTLTTRLAASPTCISGSSGTLTVNAAPGVPAAPTASVTVQPTCSVPTGTIVITAPTGAAYEYSMDGGTYQSGTTFSGVAVGNHTLRTRLVASPTCISVPSVTLTVNAVPTLPPAPTASVTIQPTCAVPTGTIVVTAPTGASYQYNMDGGAYQSSVTFAGVSVGNHTLTTRLTASPTCISGPSSTLTVNAVPALPDVPTATVTVQPTCAVPTGTIVVTAPTGAAYEYNMDGGTYQSSVTFTGVSAGNHTLTTRLTASPTCISGSSGTLTVNAAPGVPAAPTASVTVQPTCSVPTGTIVITAPTGAAYEYSMDGGTYQSGTTFSGVAVGNHTLRTRLVASPTCISVPGGLITVNAQPPTPVVPAQTASISSGGTFTVTPSGVTIPVGTTYTWPAPTYTGFVTGGVAQLTPQLNISGTLTNPSGVGTAIYNVTPTSGPCTGTNFLVTVTVTSTCIPVAVVTQPTNTSMCATSGNASFTLIASGTGPFNYQWQYNNGGTWGAVVNGTPAGALYSNSTTPTLNVSGISTAGIPQYRCYITNCEGGNNTTSNIVNLTVNALPIPTLTSSDADNTFCFGTPVTFTAGGGTNYNFRVNGVTLQNGTSTTFTTSTLANGQIVSVIVTNNPTGCSASPIQIQNIVNPEPFVLITSPTICSADFLTYSFGVTVTPGGVVTCSSPLATVINTIGAIWAITGVPAGINVNITVTDINGCTKTILVTAPDCNCPVVTAPVSSGDKSYCAGGVIPVLTVTVQPGKTADWYNSSSGGTPVLQGSLSYTPSIAGTYYALAREISSGCVSSTRTAVTLTMNPLPVTSLSSSDPDNVFCAGTSIIFTASGGTNYNFLVNGSSVQDGASATFTTTSLTNGQVVRVMVTNVNGCSQISAPITNTVNPAPTPTLISSDPDNIFCAGTSVTFTAGGGTIYDFRINDVTVQSGALATYITNLLTNGQIVNVVVSNANGCTATSSNIVNSVNPLPIPELVSSDADNTFCAGTNVTFTAGGGTNFDFRVGGISVQSGTLSAYSTTSLTNGQVVDVIVANATGCSVISTGIFNTVNPQPVTNAGTGGNVCNLKFRFNAIPSTGIGTWTKTTGPGTATFDPNPNTPDATVTVSEYGTYTFTWTEVSGPCSGSSTITVNFYQQPVAGAGTGGNNCGLEFHFNATLNVGTGTWVKVSGPGNATFSPDVNTANALVTVTTYGTYNFSWTVVNGTCSDTANVNVAFIEQLPADAGSGGSECDKDFILNANVTTTGTGTWTKASGPGNAVFTPDNHQADAIVSVDQSGSYDFAWTVVNSTCNSTDIISVVFHDLPVINAGRDTAICKGSSVQLQASGTGTFLWVPVELLSNPDIMNPVATPDTTTTFEVSLIDQFGCKNKDSIIVEVRAMLLADAGPDQELGYLFFTNMDAELAHSYETGVWTVISGTGEFTDSTSANTLVEGLSPGTNEFLWTVSNDFCPLSMDSVNIVVHGFVIPTLITPNMDGRNDNFVLNGIITLGKTELLIFDRRGARVYSNLDYDNSWNGVDYNENPLPDDTYFYVLKTENGKSLSGYIVIRR